LTSSERAVADIEGWILGTNDSGKARLGPP
jgi:hypothetical protein